MKVSVEGKRKHSKSLKDLICPGVPLGVRSQLQKICFAFRLWTTKIYPRYLGFKEAETQVYKFTEESLILQRSQLKLGHVNSKTRCKHHRFLTNVNKQVQDATMNF